MDLGLNGRRALVTAASKGIGRACAETLAAEGASVFIASRDAAAIERVARQIGAAGHRAADVADAGAVATLVQAAVATLGGLDILIVNAGGPPFGTFADATPQRWEAAFQLTFMSAANLIRESLPELRRSDQARIVNITSTTVREPNPTLILSNALRAAVTGMAKTLAGELAVHGITVNNLAPGRVLTDRIRENYSDAANETGIPLDEQLRRTAAQVPMQRFGTPEELGAACAFLCSKQAAYITGQTLAVDGNLTRGVY
ncbi:MAG: SDR family oxidoreductase [Vulcanimicrobiaceae bacterium]